MAYAAWTKGSTALLLAIRALAEAEEVDGWLVEEWVLSQPDLPELSKLAPAFAGPRAWRWIGEMEEIEATFAAHGLPDGFHQASAATYSALASFKDSDAVDLERVVAALLDR